MTCVTIHFIKHLRMFPGIKCQPSTKKTLHKRRSHAFHLTLLVDQGWMREELNPEMKCQGQVSPLRHIAVTIFPKEDTNLTQTMKGWILHRFNCISWLRILSRKQVWSCTNVHISKAMSIFCVVLVVKWCQMKWRVGLGEISGSDSRWSAAHMPF